MANVLKLFQHYAEKSSNAFHEMISDNLMKGVQYSQEEHLPHLKLLFNKYNREGVLLASPYARECNGLVIDIEQGKIVTYTDPVGSDEGDPANWEKVWSIEKTNSKSFVTKMEPGTVIRMSYLHEDKKWLVSTNRKLDAQYAFFGSGRSFYHKIENYIQNYLSSNFPHLEQYYKQLNLDQILDQSLNTHFMYLFIFNDQYGTLPNEKSEMVFVSCNDQQTLQPIETQALSLPCWTRKVVQLNEEEIEIELKQGRGVVLHQETGNKIKFDSFVYRNTFYHFQDRPILETFLMALQQKKEDRVEIIQKMYHHLNFEMKQLRLWFARYALYVHNWYKQLKIYHNNGRLAPISTTLSVIQELHQQYLLNYQPITLEKVENTLIRNIGQDPELYLGHLLHLKSEKRL